MPPNRRVIPACLADAKTSQPPASASSSRCRRSRSMLSSVSGSAANASRMRPRSTGSPLTISPPRNPSHEEVGGGIDGFDRNRGLDRQIHQGEALGLRATETDQIEILGCPRRGEPRRGGVLHRSAATRRRAVDCELEQRLDARSIETQRRRSTMTTGTSSYAGSRSRTCREFCKRTQRRSRFTQMDLDAARRCVRHGGGFA
jgi:hypothetical protein